MTSVKIIRNNNNSITVLHTYKPTNSKTATRTMNQHIHTSIKLKTLNGLKQMV